MAEAQSPESIDPGEFEHRWITPRNAILLLKHLDYSDAIEAICFRIGLNELKVAAEKVTTAHGGESKDFAFWPIGSNTWAQSDAKYDHSRVWTAGNLMAQVATRESLSFAPTYATIACMNVRFDPVGLARMLPQPERIIDKVAPSRAPAPTSYNPRPVGALEEIAPELAPYRRQTPIFETFVDPAMESGGDLTIGQVATYFAVRDVTHPKRRSNPVTTAEIKAWHRTLTKAERSLGVPALWALAKEYHPGRHLPRKMVEHFGKNRTNGHRAHSQSPK